MKRCPVSMVIRKMQIKITTRYHFTSPRTAIIFLVENIKCWQGCGEIGTLVHCQWECKMVQPLWKIIWQFLKKVKHQTYCMIQQFHFLVYSQTNYKEILKQMHVYTCSQQHFSHNSGRIFSWCPQKSSVSEKWGKISLRINVALGPPDEA